MKKKVANGKARMVFYGIRTTGYGQMAKSFRYTRNYCAVETPDIVVRVTLEVPDGWYKMKKLIDLEAEMNALAKKFFPKAELFMFYNRVTSMGIIPPRPEPQMKARFEVKKVISSLRSK